MKRVEYFFENNAPRIPATQLDLRIC